MSSTCELIVFDSEHLNVFAAEVTYCQPHWHKAPEFSYILRGGFTFTVNQQEITLQQGDFVYIGPDIIHAIEQSTPQSALVTWQFDATLFDRNHAPVTGYQTITPTHANYDALRQLADTHLAALLQTSAGFASLANTYQLLAGIEQASHSQAKLASTTEGKDDQVIKESIGFINRHYQEQITIAQLADQAHLSYYHFSRLFKKVSGYSPFEYLSMVRVNMAKPLLKDVQLPITEIAQAVGFNEHRHMTAAFKKYCGATPSEYRKSYYSDFQWRYSDKVLESTDNRPILLSDALTMLRQSIPS
ncbi:helix-turn-helix transcriptional regulator [Marinomonas ostreistagni]|uniref:helix-turn-helix transcriptional regulator n=1 Tax=Marinomonas ostreistagni TaxID=359209 RepID=UPI001950FFA3|nr:AraC family transcriptional regulator [Marinomonas ostreistagni]MBM6551019.1 AraC family transcriptional regulator [Marinomonas ostreistagni]